MQTFVALVISPCPEPATFIEVMTELKSTQVTIGKSYAEFELKLKARQAMMRDDAAGLCLLCMPNQPCMASLAASGYSTEELTESAEAILVDSVLEVAGKLQSLDVPKPVKSCAGKQTLLAIHKELSVFKASDRFPTMLSLSRDLTLLCSFVDPAGADINTLVANVEIVQNLRTSGLTSGPFVRFLL